MAKHIISVIIPTLNEEAGIAKAISAIPKERLQEDYEVEIIVVDGKSNDRTAEVASGLGANVVVEERKGYGRAYKTGFERAKGEILVSLDGDGTYPAAEIPEMLGLFVKEDLDFLTTDRFGGMGKGAMSFRNKMGNAALSIGSRILHGVPFKDSQSGMWLIRKSAWGKVKERIRADGMEFSEEIKIEFWRGGFRCREMPIHYAERSGKAKLNPWRDGIRNMLYLFQKKLR